MARQMNEGQRFLVTTIHGEFLPDQLRDGDHYAEIDAMVRNPSTMTPSDRLFTLLWKEFDDEADLEGCKEAMARLFQDLAQFNEGLDGICADPAITPKI
jgi:hypothetical protein